MTLVATGLVGIGILLIVIGLGYLYWAVRTPDHRIRRRLRALERGAAVDADWGTDAVPVTGTVAAGPDGLLTAPMNRLPCVLYRLNAMRRRGTDTSMFETLHRETGEVPFFIDDGSGRRILARAENFQLVLRTDWEVEGSPMLIDPNLRQWLTHVLGRDPNLISGRRLRFEEKWIAPGQTVTAIGSLRAAASGGSTSTAVVDTPGQPLFLTNMTIEEARRELGSNTRAAVVMTVIGAALVVAGAVLTVVA